MVSYHNRSKRGLSTVVTGVMMLSAVAVLGTAIVAWSNSNLFTSQQVLNTQLVTSVNKIKESLVIENVWFQTGSPKYINITLNNVGTIGLNVTSIKIDNKTDGTIDQINQTNNAVLPGKTQSYKIKFGWQSNVPIKILITTARDNIFTTEESP